MTWNQSQIKVIFFTLLPKKLIDIYYNNRYSCMILLPMIALFGLKERYDIWILLRFCPMNPPQDNSKFGSQFLTLFNGIQEDCFSKSLMKLSNLLLIAKYRLSGCSSLKTRTFDTLQYYRRVRFCPSRTFQAGFCGLGWHWFENGKGHVVVNEMASST